MKRSLIIILVISAVVHTGSAQDLSWSAAPAQASSRIQDTNQLRFFPVGDITQLDSFLIGDSGWIWLKTEIPTEARGLALYLPPGHLRWTAWLNGISVASGGIAPPWWFPSVPLPVLLPLENQDGSSGVLMMKLYAREGLAGLSGQPLIGNPEKLQLRKVLAIVINAGFPVAVLLLCVGMTLLALFRTGAVVRQSSPSVLFFSLILILQTAAKLTVYVPSLSDWLSWGVIRSVIAASGPWVFFGIRAVFKERSGRKEPLVLLVIDILLAVTAALWSLAPSFLPYSFLNHPSLPYYAAWTMLLILLGWIFDIAKKRRGLVLQALLILVLLLPGALAWAIEEKWGDSLHWSLELAPLAFALFLAPLAFLRGQAPLSAGLSRDNRTEDYTTRLSQSGYPARLPYDNTLDLASLSQPKKGRPAGFQAVLRREKGSVDGFALMEASRPGLDSALAIQGVRAELVSEPIAGRSIAGRLRTIHRKIMGKGSMDLELKGSVCRFSSRGMEFTPMGRCLLFVRRYERQEVANLSKVAAKADNPALGSPIFLETKLKTFSMKLEPGDTVVALAGDCFLASGPGRKAPWGAPGIAKSLARTKGRSAAEVLSDLTEDYKDYLGTDSLAGTLSAFVVRVRNRGF